MKVNKVGIRDIDLITKVSIIKGCFFSFLALKCIYHIILGSNQFGTGGQAICNRFLFFCLILNRPEYSGQIAGPRGASLN